MYKWIGKGIAVPFPVSNWFGEPNTNELAGWTGIVGICLLAVFLISSKVIGKVKGIPENWGIKTSIEKVAKSFLLAFFTVSLAYVILFASDLLFNVDYRIWVIDMRVFTVDKVLYAIAYWPAFLVFYLVNDLCVDGGNRVEGMPRWLVTLLSCFGNIAGIGTLIFIQYSNLISRGVLTYNSMRIVNLFPLIFLIPLATIISRKFFRKTGGIYLGAFIMSMLYTMMTVANTMMRASIL